MLRSAATALAFRGLRNRCVAFEASRAALSSSSRSQASSQDFIDLEAQFGATNYSPVPVVIAKGEGPRVWDVEGKEYLDFLSAYSAVNQGHCHPRIVDALIKQAPTLTLTSRAFHNNLLGPYEKFVTEFFGYDRVLPMNTGVEGGETAIKLCRRWGYKVKGIPDNKAKVVFAKNNFWGRTLAAVSSSTDPSCFEGFGPYMPGFPVIDYNDLEALEKQLQDPDVCAFYVEPVQGEAGVVVPQDGFMSEAKRLCEKYNCLLVADEIQTGLGRTGYMLAVEHDKCRPDVVVLGKALSGGVFPVSAVLADNEVMLGIKPGEHGSTYGGNPLACAVAMEALKVLKEEGLVENSQRLGEVFRKDVGALNLPFIKDVRGRGLMNAVEISADHHTTAWEITLRLKEAGLLAKPTHDHIIRFTPPLCMTDADMDKGLAIIKDVLQGAA